MNTFRRMLLKSAVGAGLLWTAAGTGLLRLREAAAAWPEAAFKAKTGAEALTALYGAQPSPSTEITIKAPDIAENGAVVPITVSTTLKDVEEIGVVVEQNPTPLAANFVLSENALPEIKTRIKMGKTSNVVAVVKSGGKLYSAAKEVKVTIGGCGG